MELIQITAENKAYYELVKEAHELCVDRQNASTMAVINSGIASGSYMQAIASALLTTGGKHAPLTRTYEVLFGEIDYKNMDIIPGWGSSFEKGRPDPIWEKAHEELQKQKYQSFFWKAQSITEFLHKKGKKVYPNASLYTTILGMVLGIRKEVLPYLFIKFRLEKWTEIFWRNLG